MVSLLSVLFKACYRILDESKNYCKCKIHQNPHFISLEVCPSSTFLLPPAPRPLKRSNTRNISPAVSLSSSSGDWLAMMMKEVESLDLLLSFEMLFKEIFQPLENILSAEGISKKKLSSPVLVHLQSRAQIQMSKLKRGPELTLKSKYTTHPPTP